MAEPTEKKPVEKSLPVYSWEEVKKHRSPESLWLVVQDKVYDVTEFMEEVSTLGHMLTSCAVQIINCGGRQTLWISSMLKLSWEGGAKVKVDDKHLMIVRFEV